MFENIPGELRERPNWVVRRGKVPLCPRTGEGARAGDPATWGTWGEALEALARGGYDGVGFEFDGGGIVGVDVDHAVDPKTGEISELAREIVAALDSYTEYSPSGTGLHILARGDLPEDGRKNTRHGIEFYKDKRYFTVTGNLLEGRGTIQNRPEELQKLFARFFPKEERAPRTMPKADKDYLAIGLERDEALKQYWNGRRDSSDESSNDMAFMNKLAYWCCGDADRMVEAFCASPYAAQKDPAHAKKLDRKDYLPRTAREAAEKCGRTAQENDQQYKKDRAKRDFQGTADVFGRAEYTQPPPSKRLSTVSARELQDKDLPPVRFIVLGMLPQGLAVLASPPKFGKSWMVLDLCLCVAAGWRFMGHDVSRCGCLYLALEDSLHRLQDRMNKVLQGERAPEGFDYAIHAGDLAGGLLEQLEAYIKERPGTGLIVVDTLQKVRGTAGKTESAYGADYREVGALKEFADKHGVCLLLVHHLRKMKDVGDVFNQISGTAGISGAADTMLVLDREKRGDTQTKLSITGRDVESSETMLKFDKTLYRWQVLGDADFLAREAARLEYQESPVVATIKKLLDQNNGRWSGTMKDLMDAGTYIARTYLADTPRALAKKVAGFERPLFEYDGIVHNRAKNGTGGGRHHFYRAIVGPEETNIGLEGGESEEIPLFPTV